MRDGKGPARPRISSSANAVSVLARLRVHWALPEIVVEVAFIKWTMHGKLRHPRLLGGRDDKAARGVVRETW